MRGPNTGKRKRAAFLTIEMLLSIGLAAAAFASFLQFYGSVRQQHEQLRHFANATLFLQSTVERVRLGDAGTRLEKLHWSPAADAEETSWETAPQSAGRYRWFLTAEERPEAGKLFAFKTVVTWQERGRAERISAATQMWLP